MEIALRCHSGATPPSNRAAASPALPQLVILSEAKDLHTLRRSFDSLRSLRMTHPPSNRAAASPCAATACHPERSQGSPYSPKILRLAPLAQDDASAFQSRSGFALRCHSLSS